MQLINKNIIEIAMQQSAIDINCNASDFTKNTNVIVNSCIPQNARRYYKEPIACNLVSYGNNIVASIDSKFYSIVSDYLQKFEFYHCFETPNMNYLNEKFIPLGQKVCFMAEYFLPDVNRLQQKQCGYKLKLFEQNELSSLYAPEWSNALSKSQKEYNVLAMGAFDGEKLVGLAGSSCDCTSMWQIGVDVLPDYRAKGVASCLVSNLSLEILSRGKVPFYCCAWSNICSVRTAIKAGLVPSWVELTVKPSDFVDNINGKNI